MSKYTPGGLTPEQDEKIRQRMYGGQDVPGQEPDAVPALQSLPVSSNAPSPTGLVLDASSDSAPRGKHRWRFGLTLMLLSVWVMAMVGALPDDSRRWLFFGFSVTMAAVAAWILDRASKKRRKPQR